MATKKTTDKSLTTSLDLVKTDLGMVGTVEQVASKGDTTKPVDGTRTEVTGDSKYSVILNEKPVIVDGKFGSKGGDGDSKPDSDPIEVHSTSAHYHEDEDDTDGTQLHYDFSSQSFISDNESTAGQGTLDFIIPAPNVVSGSIQNIQLVISSVVVNFYDANGNAAVLTIQNPSYTIVPQSNGSYLIDLKTDDFKDLNLKEHVAISFNYFFQGKGNCECEFNTKADNSCVTVNIWGNNDGPQPPVITTTQCIMVTEDVGVANSADTSNTIRNETDHDIQENFLHHIVINAMDPDGADDISFSNIPSSITGTFVGADGQTYTITVHPINQVIVNNDPNNPGHATISFDIPNSELQQIPQDVEVHFEFNLTAKDKDGETTKSICVKVTGSNDVPHANVDILPCVMEGQTVTVNPITSHETTPIDYQANGKDTDQDKGDILSLKDVTKLTLENGITGASVTLDHMDVELKYTFGFTFTYQVDTNGDGILETVSATANFSSNVFFNIDTFIKISGDNVTFDMGDSDIFDIDPAAIALAQMQAAVAAAGGVNGNLTFVPNALTSMQALTILLNQSTPYSTVNLNANNSNSGFLDTQYLKADIQYTVQDQHGAYDENGHIKFNILGSQYTVVANYQDLQVEDEAGSSEFYNGVFDNDMAIADHNSSQNTGQHLIFNLATATAGGNQINEAYSGVTITAELNNSGNNYLPADGTLNYTILPNGQIQFDKNDFSQLGEGEVVKLTLNYTIGDGVTCAKTDVTTVIYITGTSGGGGGNPNTLYGVDVSEDEDNLHNFTTHSVDFIMNGSVMTVYDNNDSLLPVDMNPNIPANDITYHISDLVEGESVNSQYFVTNLFVTYEDGANVINPLNGQPMSLQNMIYYNYTTNQYTTSTDPLGEALFRYNSQTGIVEIDKNNPLVQAMMTEIDGMKFQVSILVNDGGTFQTVTSNLYVLGTSDGHGNTSLIVSAEDKAQDEDNVGNPAGPDVPNVTYVAGAGYNGATVSDADQSETIPGEITYSIPNLVTVNGASGAVTYEVISLGGFYNNGAQLNLTSNIIEIVNGQVVIHNNNQVIQDLNNGEGIRFTLGIRVTDSLGQTQIVYSNLYVLGENDTTTPPLVVNGLNLSDDEDNTGLPQGPDVPDVFFADPSSVSAGVWVSDEDESVTDAPANLTFNISDLVQITSQGSNNITYTVNLADITAITNTGMVVNLGQYPGLVSIVNGQIIIDQNYVDANGVKPIQDLDNGEGIKLIVPIIVSDGVNPDQKVVGNIFILGEDEPVVNIPLVVEGIDKTEDEDNTGTPAGADVPNVFFVNGGDQEDKDQSELHGAADDITFTIANLVHVVSSAGNVTFTVDPDMITAEYDSSQTLDLSLYPGLISVVNGQIVIDKDYVGPVGTPLAGVSIIQALDDGHGIKFNVVILADDGINPPQKVLSSLYVLGGTDNGLPHVFDLSYVNDEDGVDAGIANSGSVSDLNDGDEDLVDQANLLDDKIVFNFNGTDPDGDPLTFSFVGQNGNTIVVNAVIFDNNNQQIGTHQITLINEGNGKFSVAEDQLQFLHSTERAVIKFEYTANDGHGNSAPATGMVTILGNDPVAQNDSASGVLGASITLNVLTNDNPDLDGVNPSSVQSYGMANIMGPNGPLNIADYPTLLTLNSNGTVTVNSGVLPPLTGNQQYVITLPYTGIDVQGETASAVATITVSANCGCSGMQVLFVDDEDGSDGMVTAVNYNTNPVTLPQTDLNHSNAVNGNGVGEGLEFALPPVIINGQPQNTTYTMTGYTITDNMGAPINLLVPIPSLVNIVNGEIVVDYMQQLIQGLDTGEGIEFRVHYIATANGIDTNYTAIVRILGNDEPVMNVIGHVVTEGEDNYAATEGNAVAFNNFGTYADQNDSDTHQTMNSNTADITYNIADLVTVNNANGGLTYDITNINVTAQDGTVIYSGILANIPTWFNYNTATGVITIDNEDSVFQNLDLNQGIRFEVSIRVTSATGQVADTTANLLVIGTDDGCGCTPLTVAAVDMSQDEDNLLNPDAQPVNFQGTNITDMDQSEVQAPGNITYSIANLAHATGGSGNYTYTVTGVVITDNNGNPVVNQGNTPLYTVVNGQIIIDNTNPTFQGLDDGEGIKLAVSILVNDGTNSQTVVSNLYVLGTNDGPVVQDLSYTNDEDGLDSGIANSGSVSDLNDGLEANDKIVFDFVGSDVDGDSLTYSFVGQNGNTIVVTAVIYDNNNQQIGTHQVTLINEGNGKFSVAEGEMQFLHSTERAVISFQYIANDGTGDSAPANGTVTILGNDPYAVDDSASGNIGDTITLNVLSNDGDNDGVAPTSVQTYGNVTLTGPNGQPMNVPAGLITTNADGTVVANTNLLQPLPIGQHYTITLPYTGVDAQGETASAVASFIVEGNVTGLNVTTNDKSQDEDNLTNPDAPQVDFQGTIVTDMDQSEVIPGDITYTIANLVNVTGGTGPYTYSPSGVVITYNDGSPVINTLQTPLITFVNGQIVIDIDNPAFQNLNDGQGIKISFDITVTDAIGQFQIVTSNLYVLGTNDGPVCPETVLLVDDEDGSNGSVQAVNYFTNPITLPQGDMNHSVVDDALVFNLPPATVNGQPVNATYAMSGYTLTDNMGATISTNGLPADLIQIVNGQIVINENYNIIQDLNTGEGIEFRVTYTATANGVTNSFIAIVRILGEDEPVMNVTGHVVTEGEDNYVDTEGNAVAFNNFGTYADQNDSDTHQTMNSNTADITYNIADLVTVNNANGGLTYDITNINVTAQDGTVIYSGPLANIPVWFNYNTTTGVITIDNEDSVFQNLDLNQGIRFEVSIRVTSATGQVADTTANLLVIGTDDGCNCDIIPGSASYTEDEDNATTNVSGTDQNNQDVTDHDNSTSPDVDTLVFNIPTATGGNGNLTYTLDVNSVTINHLGVDHTFHLSQSGNQVVLVSNEYEYLNDGQAVTLTVPYTITDANGNTASSTFTISIIGTDDGATIENGNFVEDEDAILQAVSGDLDDAGVANNSTTSADGTLRFDIAARVHDVDNVDKQFIPIQSISMQLEIMDANGGTGQFVTVIYSMGATGLLTITNQPALDVLNVGQYVTLPVDFVVNNTNLHADFKILGTDDKAMISDPDFVDDEDAHTMAVTGDLDHATENVAGNSQDPDGVLSFDVAARISDVDNTMKDFTPITNGSASLEVMNSNGGTGQFITVTYMLTAAGILTITNQPNLDQLAVGEYVTLPVDFVVNNTDLHANFKILGTNDGLTDGNEGPITVNEGDSATINLLDNAVDIDGDDVDIQSIDELKINGVVIDPANYSQYITWDPETGQFTLNTANINVPNNSSMPVVVKYTVTDNNGATDQSTATFNVVDPNLPPVANPDRYIITDPIMNLPVIINDSDPDGDPISIVPGSLADLVIDGVPTSNISDYVTLNPNGTVRLDSTNIPHIPGGINQITFTYTITDGNGGTSTTTVTALREDPSDNITGTATDAITTQQDPLKVTDVIITDIVRDYHNDDVILTPENDNIVGDVRDVLIKAEAGDAIAHSMPASQGGPESTYASASVFIANNTFNAGDDIINAGAGHDHILGDFGTLKFEGHQGDATALIDQGCSDPSAYAQANVRIIDNTFNMGDDNLNGGSGNDTLIGDVETMKFKYTNGVQTTNHPNAVANDDDNWISDNHFNFGRDILNGGGVLLGDTSNDTLTGDLRFVEVEVDGQVVTYDLSKAADINAFMATPYFNLNVFNFASDTFIFNIPDFGHDAVTDLGIGGAQDTLQFTGLTDQNNDGVVNVADLSLVSEVSATGVDNHLMVTFNNGQTLEVMNITFENGNLELDNYATNHHFTITF